MSNDNNSNNNNNSNLFSNLFSSSSTSSTSTNNNATNNNTSGLSSILGLSSSNTTSGSGNSGGNNNNNSGGIIGSSTTSTSSTNNNTTNANNNANNNNLFGLSNLTGVVPTTTGSSTTTTSNSNTNSSSSTNTGNGGAEELLPLVIHLTNPEQREGVLLELSKKRESFPDLAPILWHTYGTVAALLQEIVSIYPLLSPPTLTAHASNRVCNALALLQCVASHPDTRSLFLSAHVPLYLYPFLNTQSKSRPFEYLRLTSLGVVGALVKMDDADVINFLLQTEIIPLCLRIMETGSELSKTVATFIVQKILLDDIGLNYVCATAERFYAVSTVLNNMIGILVLSPSVRLLKHIVRCYLRLSDNERARQALRQCLPMSLRDETFGNALRDDVTVKKWLSQLLTSVGPPVSNNGGGAAGGMMEGLPNESQ